MDSTTPNLLNGAIMTVWAAVFLILPTWTGRKYPIRRKRAAARRASATGTMRVRPSSGGAR